MDRITIADLEVFACVGVTEAERSAPQRLLVTLVLFLKLAGAGESDELEDTIDYAAVAERVREVAGAGSRKLIESLAFQLAAVAVEEFHAQSATVEIKKFVLPDTQYVSVKLVHRGK